MFYYLVLFAFLTSTACSFEPTSSSGARAEKATELPADSFDLDYIMGKFEPANHPDFVEIGTQFASDKGMFLRKDAYEAFKKMHASALEDGISLIILSAARNFDRQKAIWEAKWNGVRKVEGEDLSQTVLNPAKRALKILTYSSMPGTSRHHWGTDIDLNSLEPSFFESGEGQKIYAWLSANAIDFGFCQPYSPKGKERPFGYNEEKWHWSFMPIAVELTNLAKKELKDNMISGFDGAKTAGEIGVVKKYVLGINKSCM